MAGFTLGRKSFISLWEKTFQARESLESDLAGLRAFFLSLKAAAETAARPSSALPGPTPAAAESGATQRPPTAPPPRTETGEGNSAGASASAPPAPGGNTGSALAIGSTGNSASGGLIVADLANGGKQLMGGSPAAKGAQDATIEQIVLASGFDYQLSAGDSVAAWHLLMIDATSLGGANRVVFDGSDETDGSFLFQGSDSADRFTGGAGVDIIIGRGGGDVLAGGGSLDRFVYGSAAESTGAGYDTLVDFDFAEDVLDLPSGVSGFDAAVAAGSLSTATFDSDLAAALTGKLGAGHAVFFTPNSGDLAGKAFLIVDGNGEAGYQAGEDFVFLLGVAPADPITDLGLFI